MFNYFVLVILSAFTLEDVSTAFDYQHFGYSPDIFDNVLKESYSILNQFREYAEKLSVAVERGAINGVQYMNVNVLKEPLGQLKSLVRMYNFPYLVPLRNWLDKAEAVIDSVPAQIQAQRTAVMGTIQRSVKEAELQTRNDVIEQQRTHGGKASKDSHVVQVKSILANLGRRISAIHSITKNGIRTMRKVLENNRKQMNTLSNELGKVANDIIRDFNEFQLTDRTFSAADVENVTDLILTVINTLGAQAQTFLTPLVGIVTSGDMHLQTQSVILQNALQPVLQLVTTPAQHGYNVAMHVFSTAARGFRDSLANVINLLQS